MHGGCARRCRNRVRKRGGVIVILRLPWTARKLLCTSFASWKIQTEFRGFRYLWTAQWPFKRQRFLFNVTTRSRPDLSPRRTQRHPLNAHTVTICAPSKTREDQQRKDAGHHYFRPAAWPPEDACYITSRSAHRITKRHPARRFQADGTRGALSRKARRRSECMAKMCPVAAEVINLRQFSAHAGKSEFDALAHGPARAAAANDLVHGEPAASAALSPAIESTFSLAGVAARVPADRRSGWLALRHSRLRRSAREVLESLHLPHGGFHGNLPMRRAFS